MAILKDLNVLGISRLNSDTYVNKIYGNGFYHTSTDNTSVLLGGGSYKPLSEFSLSGHTHTWAQITGKPIDGGSQNVGSHDCNSITTNGLWYYSSNGPTTSLGATTNDGALYSQAYSSSWVGQIAQDYRNGKLFVRGKNNGTWTQWLKILDSTATLDNVLDGDERKLITSTVTYPDLSARFKICTGVEVNYSTNELTTRYEDFPKIFKGTCATTAGTAAKVVTCSNFTSTDLVKGAIIFVTFDYTNSASVSNITMNVNNTGAKSIKIQYNSGTSNLKAVDELIANSTYLFQYDGTNWVCMTCDHDTYSWSNISDKPSTYAPSAHTHNLATGAMGTTYYLMGTTSQITGDLYRYGTNGPYMLATEVYAGSDINYKDNITPISRGFEENLFEREDITYDFTWKDSGKQSSGFIAQYIEDLMPEMVEGKEGEKHVKYDAALSKVVGAMFKRIKKLEEKINEQQKEINTLKEKIG